MRIQKIDQMVEMCKEHIAKAEINGTEVESLLTRALLVLLCAAFEKEICCIIEQRVSSLKDEDAPLVSFFKACSSSVIRGRKSSALADVLNLFGPEYKNQFNERKKEHQKEETYYNNIITNRDTAAHTEDIQMTFSDLEIFYDKGHILLDIFQETLKKTHL
ncbi:MAG: HEPN domain-containing protein [Syntrophales bacterium]|nr:HEPN domain-containing protein [Syntrophales bacterium]